MKKLRKVIHLEIGNEHYYFGSMKALCDHFGPKQLGMSYGSLRNVKLNKENPFVHTKPDYIIREGLLISAEIQTNKNID